MLKVCGNVCFASTIVAAILLIGCDNSPTPSKRTRAVAAESAKENTQANSAKPKQTEKLWLNTPQKCERPLAEAKNFTASLQTLLDTPNQTSLQGIQNQWKTLAKSYGNLYLFTQIAKVTPHIFPEVNKLDWRIAAYPVQPGYLDSFGPYLYSGLVNDLAIDLSAKNLVKQHGLTDDSDVVLGLYSLEFMLFGELRDRKASAFTVNETLSNKQRELGFQTIEETPAFRRRTLVASQVKLLEKDIRKLCRTLRTTAKSLPLAWQNMSDTDKKNVVHRILENALADAVSDIDAQLENSADTPADYRHQHSLTPQESAQLISNRLQTLTATQNYVSSAELFGTLSATSKLLDEFAGTQESQALPWKQAKESINQAIQLLSDIKKSQV